jgi:hypothetical protein
MVSSATHASQVSQVSLGPGGNSTFELKIPDSPPPSPAGSTKGDTEKSVLQPNSSVLTPDRPHITHSSSGGFHRQNSVQSFSTDNASLGEPRVAEMEGSPLLSPEGATTFDRHGNRRPLIYVPGHLHQRSEQPLTPGPLPNAHLPYRPAPSLSLRHSSWQQTHAGPSPNSFVNGQPQELCGSATPITYHSGANLRNSPYPPYSFR